MKSSPGGIVKRNSHEGFGEWIGFATTGGGQASREARQCIQNWGLCLKEETYF